jgi:hypothetical protein
MPRAKKKKEKRKKKKKDPFAVRMRRRGQEFKSLGQTLANEPKKFPHALLDLMRRSFRTVWDARGGGLFAVGYLLTFVWLEVTMFVDDIRAAESVGGFFSAQILEMFFRYLGESFKNMILALMWPVYVVTLVPPWGAIAFGLAYAAFDRLFKKPIETWLFHDDEAPRDSEPASSNVQEEN